MKFTDGYWLMRPGVSAHHAVSVADAVVTDDRLTLYAPVSRVTKRGDTLNGPLLTVDCWSPAEGVIGVRTTHHGGRAPRRPEFTLSPSGESTVRIVREGPAIELISGELSLKVDTEAPWQLDFSGGGRALTSVGPGGTGFATDGDDRHFMLTQLSLGVGECVRTRRALHPARTERPERRHLAGRRRDEQ